MEGPVIKSKSTHLHEKANAYQGRTEAEAHQRTIHITAASMSDNEDLSKNTTKCLIQINQSVRVYLHSLSSVLCRCELSSILTTISMKACMCVWVYVCIRPLSGRGDRCELFSMTSKNNMCM